MANVSTKIVKKLELLMEVGVAGANLQAVLEFVVVVLEKDFDLVKIQSKFIFYF